MSTEKTALLDRLRGLGKSVAGDTGTALHGALTVGLGTAAAAGIGTGARELYMAATKHRDFRAMLAANPDLSDHHAQDPKKMNLFFSSLRNMNPSFSQDPVVAGSYLRQMVESHQPGGVVMQAAQSRDSFKSPLMDAFIHGAGEGAKGYGVESMKERGNNRRLDRQLAENRLISKQQREDTNLGAELQRNFMAGENAKRYQADSARASQQREHDVHLEQLKSLHHSMGRPGAEGDIGKNVSLMQQMQNALKNKP